MSSRKLQSVRGRAARLGFMLTAATIFVASCDENLPSGPNTFNATLRIVVPRDTIIVGDSSFARAEALDASGNVIQALKFNWTTADANVVEFAPPASGNEDAEAGRTKTMVARRTGRSVVTVSLPDARFVVANTSRTQTVVVGGVRVLSTRDSTLTSINDTARAIAAGLVRSNGQLVTRASQGLRWTKLGSATALVGTGDTVRYIARANGVDTLIATHDFCLAGAKCADTVIARVAQQLLITLSARNFTAWSFGDSVGPSVTLADRRGNGLAGTSIRFIPVTANDAAIVRPTTPIGTSNFATGAMAVPKAVTIGNGTARVQVQGIMPDGFNIAAVDSFTVVVRQVARRVAVEPLRGQLTNIDSIPIRPVARDARGAPIADATILAESSDLNVHGIWVGPTTLPAGGTSIQGTILPSLSGVAVPQNNPGAPQIPVSVDPAIITVVKVDTLTAGATSRSITLAVLDSNAIPAVGQWVRLSATDGSVADSVQVAADGQVTIAWTPPDLAGTYTLTAVRSAPVLFTRSDSAGRIIVKKTVVVIADVPASANSNVTMNATTLAVNTTATITINVRDRFGNLVRTATAADFAVTNSAGGGTITGMTCSLGTCTATYTAPAVPGTDVLSVKIGGVDILGSPITITIQ
jgi:hypothetical protein